MEAISKDEPVLEVATAKARLVSALAAIGFKPLKGRPRSVVMNLNDETQVVLYPGVSRRSGSVLIDPVIALYNAKLQARLLHSGKGDARVCHAYLGMLDSWGRLYVDNDEELEVAIRRVVRSVVEVGLPIMREYDSLGKVKRLFQDDLAHKKGNPVAVLFGRQSWMEWRSIRAGTFCMIGTS